MQTEPNGRIPPRRKPNGGVAYQGSSGMYREMLLILTGMSNFSARNPKKLPTNTNGGLLSQAHLGAMHHVVEATLQLRGEAGERQADKNDVAVVHGNGGIVSAHSTVVLGKEALS